MGNWLSVHLTRREARPLQQRERNRHHAARAIGSPGKKGDQRPGLTRSRAGDPSKLSFLDLPPELRNDIYTRLLVIEDYVWIGPRGATKAPAVVLLRTCKQVHDEAASVFYGANSFYCCFHKTLPLLTDKEIRELEMAAWFLQMPDIDPTRNEAITQGGGLFFPAPRYHAWVTRLTIDIRILTDVRGWYYDYEMGDWRKRHHGYCQMFDKVEEGVAALYESMQATWAAAKERAWDARMLGPPRESGWAVMSWTMSFAMEAREEMATKAALRCS